MFDDQFLASLNRLDAALEDLRAHELTALAPATLAAAFQRLETHSRRRDSLEHVVVAEIDARGLGFEAGYSTTAGFLRGLSNITPADAQQRARAGQNLAPGRTVTGEPVPAIFPAVAAAEAAGVLSAAHARVITGCIDTLPPAVAAQWDRVIERDLVEHATVLDPRQLATAARRIAYLHDQDGVLADEAYRERIRTLTVSQRADGSAHVQGELTAPCAEALLTVLDCLAAPQPETDGLKDPRSAGQRHHDGLLDGLNRLQADGGLPSTGGVNATILLTITEDQLHHRALDATAGDDDADSAEHGHDAHRPDRQLVRTGHGALISLAMALTIATDAHVIPIIFRGAHEIAAYGHTHRIASPNQRLALIARDQGCSFPGCTIPPAWCQTHHITGFHLNQQTRVDDLTLLCGHHHRTYDKHGWTCHMITGIPHWTPPPRIDPNQTPRRNTAHL